MNIFNLQIKKNEFLYINISNKSNKKVFLYWNGVIKPVNKN